MSVPNPQQWRSISTRTSLHSCVTDTLNYQVTTRQQRSKVATDANAAADLSVPNAMQVAMQRALQS